MQGVGHPLRLRQDSQAPLLLWCRPPVEGPDSLLDATVDRELLLEEEQANPQGFESRTPPDHGGDVPVGGYSLPPLEHGVDEVGDVAIPQGPEELGVDIIP